MTPRGLHTRRWLPRGRLARRTRGPLLGGVWLRCITWWRAPALDAELAAGADPIDAEARLDLPAHGDPTGEALHPACDLTRGGEAGERQRHGVRQPNLAADGGEGRLEDVGVRHIPSLRGVGLDWRKAKGAPALGVEERREDAPGVEVR